MKRLSTHLRVITASILCAVVASQPLQAGTTGKIAGNVKDSNTGEPIIGANVVLEGTSMGAATDFEGYYTILNVKPGTYTLVVSAVGYNKKTMTNVSVSVDLTTTIDVVLDQTVLEIGQEVVITAERPAIQKDLTSSESRVTAEQIKSLPVREVREVLALQSGVTVDRGGGIHIRGGRTTEVAYWVDGVSVSDVYDRSQAVQVDNKSIQELQVISGTFNAEYGQAMSGIVNIVTKDGDQNFHGSISGYSGGYFSSDGYRNDGKVIPVSAFSNQPSSLLGDKIFYNLNQYRPFDNTNIEASVSGPVPEIPELTFYASARYFISNGWLYGNKVFQTNGMIDTTTVRILPTSSGFDVAIGDNPVAMNRRERFSGQGKLTYQFTPSMKLSVSALLSNQRFRDYSHDWKLVPEGDVEKFDRGYNVSAIWTHTLTATSFYTMNASYIFKGFRERLYEDPLDPRYVLNPAFQDKPVRSFNFGGTNLHHFKRRTETRVAKFDYTDQVSKLHQLKGGAEFKLHRLYFEDFDVAPDSTELLRGVYKPSIPRFPVFVDGAWHATSHLYQEYTAKPVEFSAYIQDKLEYDRMIVNIGVRFDYFDSKGKILSDPRDPNVYLPQKIENKFRDLNGNGTQETGEPSVTLQERLRYWYKEASPKYSFSPRLGISYPITDQGALHFSYGHFLQIPTFQYLYQRPGYKVTTASGVQGVFGNPDLKPEKTVQYELGLQQQLSDVVNVDVTAFYKDIRDWVSTSPQIAVRDPGTATTYYTMFVNKDYANVRGISLTLDKRMSDMYTMNISYLFQIAEGVNSNPEEEQSEQEGRAGADIVVEKVLTPLAWDQTHTLNLTLGIGEEDWGAFVLGRYGSGLPYTAVVNQADLRGQEAAKGVGKNTRRRPSTYTIDFRLFKNFTLAAADLTVFLKVFNLFDRRNEIEVYGETGRATATPEALGLGAATGGDRVNTIQQHLNRPDFYSEPREIQFGIEMNL